ncbi:MAG: ferredoxin [Candidatus Thorarchaeota archaeon]|nr:MAG: ferredoxin [Candidatus Thorarchaeota archaeon]
MPKKARRIIINPKLCKGCHICISVCPQKVLDKSKKVDNRGYVLPIVIDLDACRVCRLCEIECPDFAISVIAD